MNSERQEEIQELNDTLVELRPELSINSTELDEECRRQPEKYEIVGEIATRAKALARRAKDELDYLEANIKSKIRKDPEKYGLSAKVTNDAVNEALTVQDEFQEAKKDYIDISKIADSFSILVASMEQRKAMLRDLVSLYIHKYYSNQSLSGEERSLDKDFEEDLAEERSRDVKGE